jgi:ribosomal protein S12
MEAYETPTMRSKATTPIMNHLMIVFTIPAFLPGNVIIVDEGESIRLRNGGNEGLPAVLQGVDAFNNLPGCCYHLRLVCSLQPNLKMTGIATCN